MSDEFDKEAEREKLREKFAEDEKKREHTQRMSELLLKGATMTNKHCERCSDPIFRHDGREFCPTCNRPADGGDASTDATRATEGSNAEVSTARDVGTASANDGETPERDSEPATGRIERDDVVRRRDLEGTVQPDDGSDDVADARTSLTRTLTRFARAADHTDDPRRAREHLKAAREAAEALSALDR
ncbi:Sjogren's syndrome/scleroderma autoantigen 1 family protein [Halorubrum sp. DTA98]|uniref:Sjogren's syndrome/scleroderma autoantigen 1 family protein n=1 Tax=Halorubrum sp. DTA98 TaxID=3402163 RepID=UPI003AAE558D